MTRKSLTDILRDGDRQNLSRVWTETEAAGDLRPLPAGEYVCHLVAADLFNARTNGTPGVKLAFRVLDGEHNGRHVWHDLWLTAAALPMTKRDLAKLGISTLEQLEQPIPPGIRCRVKVTLRKDDDGTQYNRVRAFEVVGIDKPTADPFAPPDGPAAPSISTGDAAEPAGPVDASFDPTSLDGEGGTA